MQLLSACKPEPASGEGDPAKVPVTSGTKYLCGVLLCMAIWEAILSGRLQQSYIIKTHLDLQVELTCCSQLLSE